MKKTLLLATLLTLGATTMAWAGPQGCPECGPQGCPPFGPPCGMHKPCPNQHPPKVNMEQKLKLTDEQKAKAKQLRMEGREQMEPIMNAIRTKYEQKELIKRSKDIKTQVKLEQIEKINAQIDALNKQARDLRLKNERDFEAILTSKQKKELDKIKADARKNMAKEKAKNQKSAPKKK
ncbi:MAG: Spy/CpxP family protein refolding chaperone [Cyanobacteria bacterium RUI128]|nr:Spy/CpxP family protein refolding chaperone [Cyanobacteria bacterium RUI128]